MKRFTLSPIINRWWRAHAPSQVCPHTHALPTARLGPPTIATVPGLAPPPAALGQRGQASVLLGMMMLTFILFFAFVINTGMLVNAKINLQNAADLAAYAGAATQARQLNQISFLNYEMRRAYKKFLFRYYVLGNLAQKTHPRTAAQASGARVWSPAGGTVNYGVPAVCMVHNDSDNFCQLDKLAKIELPPQTFLDSINDTLRDQLTQIEAIRQAGCLKIGATNLQVLTYWIWNTDPDLAAVETQLASAMTNPTDAQNLKDTLVVIKSLASGLGLAPREAVHKMRIEALMKYVNHQAETGVTYEKAQEMQRSADPAKRERTIQAMMTAYNTLGTHTFDDSESIVLDELLPSGSDGSALLLVKPIEVAFDTFAVDFTVPTGGDPNKDCTPKLIHVPTGKIPVGVYKDASLLTYYALRLTAKAHTMFSPFGDLELKAYAAAQPFGSRIGPVLTDDFFLWKDARVENSMVQTTSINESYSIPNLPVLEQDGTGAGQGWDNNLVIYNMYANFYPGGVADYINTVKIGTTEMNRAYQAAMAPNPWEAGRYNIAGDFTPISAPNFKTRQDAFNRYFDETGTMAFWAPLTPLESTQSAQDIVKGMISAFQPPTSAGFSADASAGLSAALLGATSAYFTKLRESAGENNEGYNIFRTYDPFYNRPDATTGAMTPITLPPEIFLSDPTKVKTSWNEVHDSAIAAEGRTGYSVKLVSFQSLTTPTTSPDGSSKMTNTLVPDSTAEGDVPFLKH